MRKFFTLLFLALSIKAQAAISNVEVPGYTHVVIDECPDNMDYIVASGQSIKLISDDFWTTEPNFFFGYSATQFGNWHSIDLHPLVGLHAQPEEAGQLIRWFSYSYPSYSKSITIPTVQIPEPTAFVLMGIALLLKKRS